MMGFYEITESSENGGIQWKVQFWDCERGSFTHRHGGIPETVSKHDTREEAVIALAAREGE